MLITDTFNGNVQKFYVTYFWMIPSELKVTYWLPSKTKLKVAWTYLYQPQVGQEGFLSTFMVSLGYFNPFMTEAVII